MVSGFIIKNGAFGTFENKNARGRLLIGCVPQKTRDKAWWNYLVAAGILFLGLFDLIVISCVKPWQGKEHAQERLDRERGTEKRKTFKGKTRETFHDFLKKAKIVKTEQKSYDVVEGEKVPSRNEVLGKLGEKKWDKVGETDVSDDEMVLKKAALTGMKKAVLTKIMEKSESSRSESFEQNHRTTKMTSMRGSKCSVRSENADAGFTTYSYNAVGGTSQSLTFDK